MSLSLRALCVVPLALAGCKAPDVPRSPAPWITLGASNNVVTSLDTSRIVREPSTRVVWVRQTRGRTSDDLASASVQAETRHRVDCGARTVADLAGADTARTGPARPFDTHPYGKRVFGTVCNALGNLPAPR